jgi:N-acetyl-anhydromuramyl-L-alanine amidase AmpD
MTARHFNLEVADQQPLVIPGFPRVTRIHSRVLGSPLAAPRFGIMLHYDDSTRDDWSLEWFQDKRCTNGYTWIVQRSGAVIELVDPGQRTPHAGVCRTPKANSVVYGIAAAASSLTFATAEQVNAIVQCCRALFAYHGWPTSEVRRRIVGHNEQAIWAKANTNARGLWGRGGRKIDPKGDRRDGRPILDVAEVRRRVARP